MAKLPGIEDLGPSPRVSGSRGVGQVDTTSIAKGAGQFGLGLQELGRDVADVQLNENRFQYAKANADFLSGHIDLDSSYTHDRDYTTVEKRYTADLEKRAQQSAAVIQNPAMRARFMEDIQPKLSQGVARIKEHAFKLEGEENKAYVEQVGGKLADQASATDNPEVRKQVIDTYVGKKNPDGSYTPGLVDGLVSRNFITPTEALHRKRAWAQQYAIADATARADRDPEGVINDLRTVPGSAEQIDNRIVQVEGTGKNSRSSAEGVGQFKDKTWVDLIKQKRPDLAEGRSDEELLTLRGDKNLAREMVTANREQNAAYLKNKGIEPNAGNVYLAHFLGPAGATAVLQAKPDQPVLDALGKAVGPQKAAEMVAANPEVLAGKTSGTVAQWAADKMGGVGPGGGHVYDLLTPQQRQTLLHHAEQQANARTLDRERALRLQEHEAQRASDRRENEILKDLYGDNPQVSAKDIVNDDKLNRQAKERMIGVAARANKPEPMAQVSQENTTKLLDRIRRSDGDPQKIVDDKPLFDAFIAGNLTRADFNFLRKERQDIGTPEGDRLSKRKAEFIKSVEHVIDKSNPLMGKLDPSGKQQLYNFNFDVERRVDEYRKAGKNPYDLFDPSKPDFLGKPEAIAPYQKTLQQSLQDRAKAITGAPGAGSAVAAPAPAPRKDGETPEEYLKRAGKK